LQTNQSEPAAATPSHFTVRELRPTMFYIIVVLVFVSDQLSKAWIKNMLPARGGEMPILGNAFLLSLTYNRGGAWGVLPQGNGLFIAFAAFAVIALLVAYHRMKRIELFVGTAFALALGGALGNLLDRLRFGSVVDFFYIKIINFPIFNVADSAITIGIFLLLIHFLRTAREEEPNANPIPAESASMTGDPATSAPKTSASTSAGGE
jgi:signal peptidase II